MTNRIALGIGLLLIAGLALDLALGLGWHIYLGRRFLDLIGVIAVWR